MLRFILIFISLAAAFWLELLFGQSFFIVGFPMPLTAAVLFLWSWRLDLGQRFFWAIGSGIFLDSIYPEFFGTYMIILFILVFLIGLLKSYLSGAGLFLTVGTAMFFYLSIFILLAYYAPWAFRFFYQTSSLGVGLSLSKVLAAAFLWPLFLVLLWGGLLKLGRTLVGLKN
jgi:hypothetical protein